MLILQSQFYVCSVESSFLFVMLCLPFSYILCRFCTNTNVQVGIPLLDVDPFLVVVSVEVVMDRKTYHSLPEVIGVSMFLFRYLRCALVVFNTQCIVRFEHDGEGNWIETEDGFELNFASRHNCWRFSSSRCDWLYHGCPPYALGVVDSVIDLCLIVYFRKIRVKVIR